jgi:hypothetical protein
MMRADLFPESQVGRGSAAASPFETPLSAALRVRGKVNPHGEEPRRRRVGAKAGVSNHEDPGLPRGTAVGRRAVTTGGGR